MPATPAAKLGYGVYRAALFRGGRMTGLPPGGDAHGAVAVVRDLQILPCQGGFSPGDRHASQRYDRMIGDAAVFAVALKICHIAALRLAVRHAV